jgi:hypothetical protein
VKLTDGLVVPVYKKKWANFKTSDFLRVLQYVPNMPFSIFFSLNQQEASDLGAFFWAKNATAAHPQKVTITVYADFYIHALFFFCKSVTFLHGLFPLSFRSNFLI